MNYVYVVIIKHKSSQNEFVDSIYQYKYDAIGYMEDLQAQLGEGFTTNIEEFEVKMGGIHFD